MLNREIFKAALFNVLVVVCFLVGAEFFLDCTLELPKIFEYCPEADIVVQQPSLNYRAVCKRDPREKLSVKKNVYRILTDSDGCRVGERSSLPDPSKSALVLLGDSFLFGFGVPYEESVGGILQQEFHNLAIYNFSVVGQSSRSYPAILAYDLKKKGIAPQWLVVGIFVDMLDGDLPRSVARERSGSYKAFGGYYVNTAVYDALQKSRVKRSLFYVETFLRQHSSLANLILSSRKNLNLAFAVSLRESMEGKEGADLQEMLLANIHRIRDVSGLSSDHMVICLIPSKREFDRAIQPGKDGVEENRDHQAGIFWETITQRLRQERFQVCNPRLGLDELARTQYPFTADGHFNAAGYQEVEKAISKCLRETEGFSSSK